MFFRRRGGNKNSKQKTRRIDANRTKNPLQNRKKTDKKTVVHQKRRKIGTAAPSRKEPSQNKYSNIERFLPLRLIAFNPSSSSGEESKIHYHRPQFAVFEPLGDVGRGEDRFIEQAQQKRAVGNLKSSGHRRRQRVECCVLYL